MRFSFHFIKHSKYFTRNLNPFFLLISMIDPPSSPTPPPPPPDLPMLYYGLVVVATAAIVLVLYNVLILKWCTDIPDYMPPQNNLLRQVATPIGRINTSTLNFISSFKYKSDAKAQDGGGGDSECAVCLSVFEEGEEVRQLPKCNHYFHAPCIDMWLYSHMDCPLCRSPVEPPGLHGRGAAAEEPEHSPQGLLVPATLV